MGRRGRPRSGMMATGPMRRGGRRSLQNRLGDVARQRLREAHEQYREGEYDAAAERFERMASVARERSLPRIATHLSARAAASHAMRDDADAFEVAFEQAVSDAQQDGDKERTARTFGRLLAAMGDSPMAERVPEFEQRVRDQLGVAARRPDAEAQPTVNRSMRRHLPQRCAACGAPVQAERIAFNEDGSVDCDFCGSILTG